MISAGVSTNNDNDKKWQWQDGLFDSHLQFILYVYVSTIDLRVIVSPLFLGHIDLSFLFHSRVFL